MGNQLLGDSDTSTNDSEFDSSVYDAAEKGDVELLRDLLAVKRHLIDAPNPDRMNHTPMHIASSRGRSEVIRTLVKHGSKSLDTADKQHWTPLFFAAQYGNVEAFETLVELGSRSLDRTDKYSQTIAHYAVQQGRMEIIDAMVRLGSTLFLPPRLTTNNSNHNTNMNTNDNSNSFDVCSSLMHKAAEHNQVAMIEMLFARLGKEALDYPARRTHRTPLHVASRDGRVAAMMVLVRLGSNTLDRPDKDGWTPIYHAASRRHDQAVFVLKALGADSTTVSPAAGSQLHAAAAQNQTPEGMLQERTPGFFIERGNVQINKRLAVEVSEEEAAGVRYNVYFEPSLLHRLLMLLHDP